MQENIVPEPVRQGSAPYRTVVYDLSSNTEMTYLLDPIEALISAAILTDKRPGELSNEAVREGYLAKVKRGDHSASIGDLAVKLSQEVKSSLGSAQEDLYEKCMELVKDQPTFRQGSWPYIDFEEMAVAHGHSDDHHQETYSCWMFSLCFDGYKPSYHFTLDENGPDGWLDKGAVPEDHKAEVMASLRGAVKTIQNITGISINIA